jgi:hypothetical protein
MPLAIASAACLLRSGSSQESGSPSSLSADLISASPQALSLPPEAINFRPIEIRIALLKVCQKGGGSLPFDEEFVLGTGESSFRIFVQGFANGVGNIGRNALHLLPTQTLNCGRRQAREPRGPRVLLFCGATPAQYSDSRGHLHLDCARPTHFRLAPWVFRFGTLVFRHRTSLSLHIARHEQPQTKRTRGDWRSRRPTFGEAGGAA